jgi:hypothetical protein
MRLVIKQRPPAMCCDASPPLPAIYYPLSIFPTTTFALTQPAASPHSEQDIHIFVAKTGASHDTYSKLRLYHFRPAPEDPVPCKALTCSLTHTLFHAFPILLPAQTSLLGYPLSAAEFIEMSPSNLRPPPIRSCCCPACLGRGPCRARIVTLLLCWCVGRCLALFFVSESPTACRHTRCRHTRSRHTRCVLLSTLHRRRPARSCPPPPSLPVQNNANRKGKHKNKKDFF